MAKNKKSKRRKYIYVAQLKDDSNFPHVEYVGKSFKTAKALLDGNENGGAVEAWVDGVRLRIWMAGMFFWRTNGEEDYKMRQV